MNAMKLFNPPHIIVALDFPQEKQAIELVKQLDPKRCRLKIGNEMFTRYGPALVEKLIHLGFDIFLDLKFHDIPNTVANACTAASALGVWMVNLHLSGGRRMVEAARNAIDKAASAPVTSSVTSHSSNMSPTVATSTSYARPLLIGVTVLTSFLDEDLREMGIEGTITDHVKRLAHLGMQAGLDGVVCSGQEAAMLKSEFGQKICLVVPGIRLPQSVAEKPVDDQRRTMTPREAKRAGADYLVVGRPITQAPNPLEIIHSIEIDISDKDV
jgi:orotidine-5'-phosphate decarboxylase